ncbi:MAG: hypothetical protein J5701_01500 [Bacteroidales bacterium]|nr:hypothetical protein [Bacteroidales bacterium]
MQVKIFSISAFSSAYVEEEVNIFLRVVICLFCCGILFNACKKEEIFARENFEHHLTMGKNTKKIPTATDSIIPIDDFCYQWFMDVADRHLEQKKLGIFSPSDDTTIIHYVFVDSNNKFYRPYFVYLPLIQEGQDIIGDIVRTYCDTSLYAVIEWGKEELRNGREVVIEKNGEMYCGYSLERTDNSLPPAIPYDNHDLPYTVIPKHLRIAFNQIRHHIIMFQEFAILTTSYNEDEPCIKYGFISYEDNPALYEQLSATYFVLTTSTACPPPYRCFVTTNEKEAWIEQELKDDRDVSITFTKYREFSCLSWPREE